MPALLACCALWPSLASAAPRSIDVQAVKVETAGVFRGAIAQDADAARSCAARQLSNGDAERWFRHATEVPNEGFQERATITGCTFSGHLRTANGQTYGWDLDIGGSATIHLDATRSISLPGKEPVTSAR